MTYFFMAICLYNSLNADPSVWALLYFNSKPGTVSFYCFPRIYNKELSHTSEYKRRLNLSYMVNNATLLMKH